MSKKKHFKTKMKKMPQPTDLSRLPSQKLMDNASLYLEREQYKKALENYRAFLAQGGNLESILEKLKQAYHGRVKELAKEGLHREAVELYEFVTRSYGGDLDPRFYIEQLFMVADYQKAIHTFYQYLEKDQDLPWAPEVESIMALFVLAEKPGIQDLIPKESLIIQQKPLVEKALQALSQKAENQATSILQPIGLRSPYRDWKMFIKGLIAFYQRRDQDALDIFNRIPKESPIAGVLPFFHYIIGLGKDIMGLIQNISPKAPSSFLPEETNFLKSIIGDRAVIFPLLQSFLRANRAKEMKEMVMLLRKCAGFLPAENDQELLKQSSLNILLHFAPKEGTVEFLNKIYTSQWGDLDSFEGFRIAALFYEKKGKWDKAIASWKNCLKEIKQRKAKKYFASKEEMNLSIALILRRIAKHCLKETVSYGHPFFNMFMGPGIDEYENEERHLSYLIDSLEYDPTDAGTYEEIIGYYHECNDQKKIVYWTEKFIEAFPGNVDALLAAATMALKRKALQKSLRYLDIALQHDPLNEKARNLKIKNHLLAAQLRIEQKKLPLARQDFEAACSLATTKTQLAMVKVTWGITEIGRGEENKGHSLIQEVLQLLKNSLVVYFYVIFEAVVKRIPDNKILSYRQDFDRLVHEEPNLEEVRNLISLPFNIYQDDHRNLSIIRPKMRLLAPYLEKAIHRLQFTEHDYFNLCHYLATAHLYPLLVHYAREGRKIYQENLRLHFFSLLGRMRGMPNYDPDIRSQAFDLMGLASEKGDKATRDEIMKVFNYKHPFYSRKPDEDDPAEDNQVTNSVLETERVEDDQPESSADESSEDEDNQSKGLVAKSSRAEDNQSENLASENSQAKEAKKKAEQTSSIKQLSPFGGEG